jgi:hypothetical protein
MHFDDPDTEVLQDSRDDEYRMAGVRDPKVTASLDSRMSCMEKQVKPAHATVCGSCELGVNEASETSTRDSTSDVRVCMSMYAFCE